MAPSSLSDPRCRWKVCPLGSTAGKKEKRTRNITDLGACSTSTGLPWKLEFMTTRSGGWFFHEVMHQIMWIVAGCVMSWLHRRIRNAADRSSTAWFQKWSPLMLDTSPFTFYPDGTRWWSLTSAVLLVLKGVAFTGVVLWPMQGYDKRGTITHQPESIWTRIKSTYRGFVQQRL